MKMWIALFLLVPLFACEQQSLMDQPGATTADDARDGPADTLQDVPDDAEDEAEDETGSAP